MKGTRRSDSGIEVSRAHHRPLVGRCGHDLGRAVDFDLELGQLGAEHRARVQLGLVDGDQPLPVDRPTGTRPRTVILFDPYARCAEKVVELPRDDVVVRLMILTYFAAAAGYVVILAFWPEPRGAYFTYIVPES